MECSDLAALWIERGKDVEIVWKVERRPAYLYHIPLKCASRLVWIISGMQMLRGFSLAITFAPRRNPEAVPYFLETILKSGNRQEIHNHSGSWRY